MLAQFKQQLHPQTPRAEGVVEVMEKGFGLLEVDVQKSYFVSPPQMKRVTHGDRIIVVIHSEKERESAESEELVEPFLTRFVDKVQGKNDHLAIIPDHLLLKNAILCRAVRGLDHEFKEDDWTVAETRRHPLKDDRSFYAELTQYITFSNSHFIPWWVTLARHNLEKETSGSAATEMLDEGLVREDLTALDFITIDSASTEDMDDAPFAKTLPDGKLQLIMAIASLTAWIAEGSKLGKAAKIRAFTNYLPGFNAPMLSRELSDDLCSLCTNEVRPVLAYCMTLSTDGTTEGNAKLFAATVESKAKLVYGQVSDWLENIGDWQPESETIVEQVRLPAQIRQRRGGWCHNHAPVSKDRPDYRLILGEKGEVLDIVAEPRRIVSHIIEEAAIAVNICMARVLRDRPGSGIYDVHMGFSPVSVDALAALLRTRGLHVDAEEAPTLDGFYKLRHELDAQSTGFLDSRIHRFQSLAEVNTEPGPHFGLGLEAYATWTLPIRKYGDVINHRLPEAVIKDEIATRPQGEITVQMAERRRLNRMAEHDVGDWLYARFLKDKAGADTRFAAEAVDISRGGIRARLIDNDAIAPIPAPFLHAMRDEPVCSQENGIVQVKDETTHKMIDITDITIAEVCVETRNIIARPVV